MRTASLRSPANAPSPEPRTSPICGRKWVRESTNAAADSARVNRSEVIGLASSAKVHRKRGGRGNPPRPMPLVISRFVSGHAFQAHAETKLDAHWLLRSHRNRRQPVIAVRLLSAKDPVKFSL